MEEKKLSRRAFLKASAMAAVGTLAVSCAKTEPEPVATPEPAQATATPKPAQATPTPEPAASANQAPMLEAKVSAGELPSLEERLPEDVYVAAPTELWGWTGEIGTYGGTWKMASKGPGDNAWWGRVAYASEVMMWAPDFTKAEVLPALASGFEVSEDGRAFSFTLRKGAKWSDGEPITSGNVQWYYDNVLGNEELTPGNWPGWLRQGDDNSECTVSDDYTFTITFKNPNGFFIWDLCQYNRWIIVYFSHYMEKFHPDFAEKDELDKMVKDAGFEDWTQLYSARAAFNDQSSESPNWAPWTMTQRVGAGEHVLWERNPYYWMVDTDGQHLPYIDGLDGKVHQAMDTMVLDAVAGEVDCQSRHLGSPANIPVYQENLDKGGFHLTEQVSPEGPTSVAFCLSMTTPDDVKRELFREKDFRLALSHAIDREEMWGLVWRGAAEFDGPKWDSPLQQDEEDEIYNEAGRYDVDLANQLLDDLGLTERDGEGFRLMKDGRRMSILMEGSITYEVKAQVLELVSQYWAEVGVEGIVKTWDRPLFQEKRANDECELCSHGDPGKGGSWTVGLMVDARMDAPVHWEADYGHRWYTWYIDNNDPAGEEPPDDVKQALALYDEVKGTPDFEKQVELYKQIRMIRANGFWWIDLGPYWLEGVTFCVTKNDMANVPPRMPGSWPWLTPGPSQTWMYYFDPPRSA